MRTRKHAPGKIEKLVAADGAQRRITSGFLHSRNLSLAKPFLILLFTLTGWQTLSATPVPDTHTIPMDAEAIVSTTQKLVDAYEEFGWFSGTVLLARNGEPVYEKSCGYADRQGAVPNQRETKYNLGSIAKHYTAVLVLQLVEEGRLGLDDPLQSFDLGFAPEIAERITVRYLLHHQSGFKDIFTAEYRANALAYDTIAKRLELLKDAPLLFEPGTESRYSNYGYVVLGAILEKVTQKPFATLLEERIFDRLGLADSVYPYRADAANQSLRYTFNHAGQQVLVGVTEHHGPDGGIEATVADVLAFYRALFYNDTLLPRAETTAGEYFVAREGHFGAYGGGKGVSAAVEMDLTNDYQIVVLTNTDQLVAEEISGRIYSFIESGHHEPALLPPEVFAWSRFTELGEESFRADARDLYKQAGYEQFIGRTINELGMSLLENQSWEDALAIFGVLVSWFPDAPQVYDSLAQAYLKMGDMKRAAETFREARRLQPDFDSDYSPDNFGLNEP